MNYFHQIKPLYKNSFVCKKCRQHCFPSLEMFLQNVSIKENDTGHCVAINDREMILASLKTGQKISNFYCKISDEEYLIKEIIK